MSVSKRRVRFGSFEFDFDSSRLEKDGERVRLTMQPAQILRALLETPGDVVTREALCARLWGNEQSADAEHSINVAVARLREALGDSAAEPVFIATVPRRGYRFVAPVGTAKTVEVEPLAEVIPPSVPAQTVPSIPARTSPARNLSLRNSALAGILAVAFVIAVFTGYRALSPNLARGEARIRLAVLPFQNYVADPNQEYFCDGLTEETITSLSRVDPGRLAVIARTSVMRYKNVQRSIRDIGRELDVDYILEGSVRRDDTRVRVTAQLIQVRDESHLWAQTWDRNLGSLIGAQSELAEKVTGELLAKLPPGGISVRQVAAEAHDEYLRGRYQWNQRNREAFLKAAAHFERAIAIDPAYARAWAGLADTLLLLASSEARPLESIAKSRAAAKRALEIEPQQADAHASLGLIAMNYDWDWAGSEQEFRRAIEINPNYSTAHHWYAELLTSLGRVDEAVAEISRARELDPLSLIIATDTGKVFYYGRRYPQAVEWLRKVLAEDQHFDEAHFYLGEALASMGRWDEALAALDGPDEGRSTGFPDVRAWVLAHMGRRDEALKIVTELERRAKADGYKSYGALGYIALGEQGKALAAYEESVSRHTVAVTSFAVHPLMDPLRGEPRFAAMMERTGLGKVGVPRAADRIPGN